MDNIFENWFFLSNVECTTGFQFNRAFGCIEETEKAFSLCQLKGFLCNFHFLLLKKL